MFGFLGVFRQGLGQSTAWLLFLNHSGTKVVMFITDLLDIVDAELTRFCS